MNNISWLLYIADLCSNFKLAAVFIMIFGTVGGIFCLGMGSDLGLRRAKIWGKIILIFVFVIIVIDIITPTQRTVYLIVGIKSTQQIMQTDTAQKALKVINKKLDKYLKESE